MTTPQPPNFLPPQSGAAPGSGYPPAPGAAGGIGAPSWQAGGSGLPTGLQSEPSSPSKSKTPLIIGILVAIAVIAAVLFFVVGGDDDSSSGVDATRARDGLETILEDGSFTDGAQQLRRCPLGDIEALTAAVGKRVTLDEDLIDGDESNALVDDNGSVAGFAYCQVFTDARVDGPTSVYIEALLDAPRNYESFVEDRYDGSGTSFDFEDEPRAHQGGEVFLFCAEAGSEDSGFTGCEADWVNRDADVTVSVFLGGDDATVDDAFNALTQVLPTVLRTLAESAVADES